MISYNLRIQEPRLDLLLCLEILEDLVILADPLIPKERKLNYQNLNNTKSCPSNSPVVQYRLYLLCHPEVLDIQANLGVLQFQALLVIHPILWVLGIQAPQHLLVLLFGHDYHLFHQLHLVLDFQGVLVGHEAHLHRNLLP